MDFSKKVKKNGLFYYRRKKLLAKWAKENRSTLTASLKSAHQQSSDTDGIVNATTIILKKPVSPGELPSGRLSPQHNSNFDEDSDQEDLTIEFTNTDGESVTCGDYDDLLHYDEIDDMSLPECIRFWALKTNQSHESINLIMDIIRRKTDGKQLPRSARTLLKTSRNATASIVDIQGGQYWYNGLRNCLVDFFRNLEHPLCISININIDGIPIYKSSKSQFWPILFNIYEIPEAKPMTIAIFFGSSKPESSEEFLRPFVNELRNVLTQGISVKGHYITVHLRCFICDAPARAFIKGVFGFNSKKWMFEVRM
ncbi:uncharacterized protein LOC131682907 isoform X3 [Topomyia yanbarensis]|uniref:uncharacterized protein LOC131682907 isoform X3 n=1 Tax=Topomyia yanbarensis TaxID=2498891 RepID=UPI00273BB116|nr:uncharacterized protein LOC131682907 isoform X3 [Topomyia yanbarensis]